MEIPQGNKLVDAYVKRLGAGVEERIESLKGTLPGLAPADDVLKGLNAWARDFDGEPLNVEIKPDSDLWPRGDEIMIGIAAKFLVLSVDIFKEPVIPENYSPVY